MEKYSNDLIKISEIPKQIKWLIFLITKYISQEKSDIYIQPKTLANSVLNINKIEKSDILITYEGIWKMLNIVLKDNSYQTITKIDFSGSRFLLTHKLDNEEKQIEVVLTNYDSFLSMNMSIESIHTLMKIFYSQTNLILPNLKPAESRTLIYDHYSESDTDKCKNKINIKPVLSLGNLRHKLTNLWKSKYDQTISEILTFKIKKVDFYNLLNILFEDDLLNIIDRIEITNIFKIYLKDVSVGINFKLDINNQDITIKLTRLPLQLITQRNMISIVNKIKDIFVIQKPFQN